MPDDPLFKRGGTVQRCSLILRELAVAARARADWGHRLAGRCCASRRSRPASLSRSLYVIITARRVGDHPGLVVHVALCRTALSGSDLAHSRVSCLMLIGLQKRQRCSWFFPSV